MIDSKEAAQSSSPAEVLENPVNRDQLASQKSARSSTQTSQKVESQNEKNGQSKGQVNSQPGSRRSSSAVVPETNETMSGKGKEKEKDEGAAELKESPEKMIEPNTADAQIGFWGKFKRLLFGDPKESERVWNLSECDLSEEDLEELRMLSVFSEHEIKVLRLRFKDVAENKEWIKREKIAALPELIYNPLAHRVVDCFDTDEDGFLDFREFVTTSSNFSPNGPREKKLLLAFKMHDYDGDDKISKNDLRSYLADITSFKRTEEEIAEEARCLANEEAAGVAGSVDKQVEWNRNQLASLKEAAVQAKTKVDPIEKNRITNRIKFLETEGVLDEVVERTFEESSSDREFLTREDFIRVLGHSDFQGKLVIDFCQIKAK